MLDLQRSGELRLTGDDRWTTRRDVGDSSSGSVRGTTERRGGQTPVRPAGSRQMLRVLPSRTPTSARLSVEQLEVLRQMLGEQRSTAVRGWAGTGKGTVAAAAGEVWRSQNRRIIAVAVAGKKAGDLAAELGAGHRARDRRAVHRAHGDGPAPAAGHATSSSSTRRAWSATEQWDELRAAIGMTAKLVMLGDDAQLPAINAGGLWPLLSRGSAELTEVYRIRSGVGARGDDPPAAWARARPRFEAYAEHGRLRLSPTRAESLQRAVHDWARDGRSGLLITDATQRRTRLAQHGGTAASRTAPVISAPTPSPWSGTRAR